MSILGLEIPIQRGGFLVGSACARGHRRSPHRAGLRKAVRRADIGSRRVGLHAGKTPARHPHPEASQLSGSQFIDLPSCCTDRSRHA